MNPDEGPPARARGHPEPRPRTDPAGGSTRACAGPPKTAARAPASPTVHPRVRGATSASLTRTSSTRGLPVRHPWPPVSRTKPSPGPLSPFQFAELPTPGFTPARAGRTFARPPYPATAPGPPPRVRGHPYWKGRHLRFRRFVPARAGRIFARFPHPATALGLPPCPRGNPGRNQQARDRRRSTPARAGSLSSSASSALSRRVDPRARGVAVFEPHPRHCRGELTPARAGVAGHGPTGAVWHRGSPPRARGPGVVPVLAGWVLHFTPARAGSRRESDRRVGALTVHPRARGVTPRLGRRRFPGSGSPPRARGNAAPPWPRPSGPGFTPARAG